MLSKRVAGLPRASTRCFRRRSEGPLSAPPTCRAFATGVAAFAPAGVASPDGLAGVSANTGAHAPLSHEWRDGAHAAAAAGWGVARGARGGGGDRRPRGRLVGGSRRAARSRFRRRPEGGIARACAAAVVESPPVRCRGGAVPTAVPRRSPPLVKAPRGDRAARGHPSPRTAPMIGRTLSRRAPALGGGEGVHASADEEDFSFRPRESERACEDTREPGSEVSRGLRARWVGYVAGNDPLASKVLVEALTAVGPRPEAQHAPHPEPAEKPTAPSERRNAWELAIAYGDAEGRGGGLLDQRSRRIRATRAPRRARAQLRRAGAGRTDRAPTESSGGGAGGLDGGRPSSRTAPSAADRAHDAAAPSKGHEDDFL